MKKVLVTGAAGSIGKKVIKYLLSEGKYEITALDLKNRNSYKALKKYSRRINIIYGDTTDPILIDALVKNHDYIIHLACIKPSLSVLKETISYELDYKGSENIVRAINFYNPKCFLIYPSTTNIYGKKDKSISTSEKINIELANYFTKSKYDVECLIKEKLSNYVIYRIPLVLTDLNNEEFMYNFGLNENIECITSNDTAYALVKTIDHQKDVNKKIFNLSGGKTCFASFKDILINILQIRGISFEYLWALLFLDKDFYGHEYKDSEKIENILHYQSESLESYYMSQKRTNKNRFLNVILAKPFIYFMKRGK